DVVTASAPTASPLSLTFDDTNPTAGFTLGVTTVSIDESAGIQQNDQSGAVPSLFAAYGTPIQWAQSTGAVLTDTSVGGADGKASVTYALTDHLGGTINGTDSGFKATATGNEIFLFTEGGLIVGRELSAGGTVAFAIALDGSNKLDVAQYEALKQDNLSGTPDDFKALSNLIYVTQTVTDGDNDVATQTSASALTVNFYDDGPTITAIQDAIMPNLSNTQADGTWQPNFGADGPSATNAITVALSTGLINGITYTLTDAPDVGGHDLKQVVVNNGTSSYTFYEYTTYDPVTHSGEMFAFADGGATTPFFELNVNMDGTYTFHLDTNTLQTTTTFDVLSQINNGPADFITINGTTVTYGSGNDPTTGFDVLIDGYSDTNTDPNANTGGSGNRISKDQNGMGLHNSNLESGETIFFKFGAQQSAFSLVVGKATTTSEHFLVTLYDQNHVVIGTENVVIPDGSTLLVDAAHWGTGATGGTGTTTGAFGNFYEVDIKNVASGSGEDQSIVITGFKFNEQVTVGNTALNFNLTTTDGDGDTFTSSDNLTVSLFGTHTGTGYQLTGSNSTSEVLVASAGADTLAGGTGSGDTVDYSNSTAGVSVNLATNAVSGGWAAGDTISGFENVIGSSFADTLTATSTGSILDGGANSTGGTDVLNGGAGNDILIASRAGIDTLTGNGGNDTFVLHGNGGAAVEITDFNAGDSIVVDVANLNLTINTAQAVTFNSAPTGGSDQTHDSAFAGSNFFFNTTTDHLYYSADNTAAHAVDLAHISTGIPAANAVHVA
ncbi:DUF5801 repeats-in-toxin domain-containing protein, partial [Bradyrhizobium sp. GCM10027634]|uniref:DUF5801 repeats-in-toxin domain-containing protein n=1 Tax=unclassified Bradyrhizobium TaxID=2631580 RepID=UPI00263B3BBE